MNTTNFTEIFASETSVETTNLNDSYLYLSNEVVSIVCAIAVQLPTWYYIDHAHWNLRSCRQAKVRSSVPHHNYRERARRKIFSYSLMFFVTSNLACVFQMLSNVLYNKIDNRADEMISFVYESIWVIARIFFYLIIIHRLRSALSRSMYQYSPFVYVSLYSIVAVQFCLGTAYLVGAYFDSVLTLIQVTTTIFICIEAIFSVVLMLLFAKSLITVM
ncbi:hypothetical protein RFI_19569, partial [Reticulomyxa filosa]